MGKSYKLIAPGFPLFRPVPPNTRSTPRWREWGKNPTPELVVVGLPHAPEVRTPESTTGTGPDTGFPMNTQTQQMVDRSTGFNT
jgi:hypothetical protein